MSLHTYDPKLLVVTFSGVPLLGFADGTFLTVERSEDMWNEVTGADGITSRAKTNNKSGLATLTLVQTSPSNDVLSALAQADEDFNTGVRPFTATDLEGTTKIFSALGYVKRIPSSEYGKEITNREWQLFLADTKIFVGGSLAVIPA